MRLGKGYGQSCTAVLHLHKDLKTCTGQEKICYVLGEKRTCLIIITVAQFFIPVTMSVTVSQRAQYTNLGSPSPVKMSGDKRRRHEGRENLSFFLNGFQLVLQFLE